MDLVERSWEVPVELKIGGDSERYFGQVFGVWLKSIEWD